ncbi:MAG: hypothetical protein HEP71_29200 [Roseivirga sp.]|nr:hypothetical protein [Roseivirga sp.]
MANGRVQNKSRVVEVKIKPALVTKLSDELLFTLENVEKQARNLKELKWLPRSRKETLNLMLEDTRKMNGLLKELMSTIRPEDEL